MATRSIRNTDCLKTGSNLQPFAKIAASARWNSQLDLTAMFSCLTKEKSKVIFGKVSKPNMTIRTKSHIFK